MLHRKNILHTLGLASALVCAPGFAAQPLPSTADPGRSILPALPNPSYIPTPSPQINSTILTAPAAIAQQRIAIKQIRLRGATAFSQAETARFFANIEHTTTSIASLYAAANELQQHYFNQGYTLSKVYIIGPLPSRGDITIGVIEGHVSSVSFDKGITPTPELRDFATRVQSMKPLNTRTLERLMLVLNSLGGFKATSVLSLPEAVNGQIPAPGAVHLTLKQVPTPQTHSTLSLDNTGSRYVGPWITRGNTSIAGALSAYDTLSLSTAITGQPGEMQQFSSEYTLPVLGASGTTVSFGASYNHNEPGRSLKSLEIKGNALNLSLSSEYPLILQRNENLFLFSGFSYKNTQTDILGDRLYKDQIRSLFAGARYSLADSWHGLTSTQLRYTHGLDVLGARKTGSPDLSRSEGRSDFRKTEFNLSRLQNITSSLSLFARVSGQYTDTPLLSSEEFGFGGSSLGRGYDPSELTGDRGLAASLEARYTLSVDETLALEPYSFYDVGKIWNIDSTSKNNQSGASAGVGLRASTASGWSLDTSAAIPISHPAEDPPSYASNGESARFTINLGYRF